MSSVSMLHFTLNASRLHVDYISRAPIPERYGYHRGPLPVLKWPLLGGLGGGRQEVETLLEEGHFGHRSLIIL